MVTAIGPKTGSPPAASPKPPEKPSAPGVPPLKDTMPEKPGALAKSLKDTVGPLPGNDQKPKGGDAKGGDSKDPVAQVWKSKYEEAQKKAAEAKDPALKAHAEAETKQIKLTLDAMEGKAPGGPDSGGAPGEGGSKKIDGFMPMKSKQPQKKPASRLKRSAACCGRNRVA